MHKLYTCRLGMQLALLSVLFSVANLTNFNCIILICNFSVHLMFLLFSVYSLHYLYFWYTVYNFFAFSIPFLVYCLHSHVYSIANLPAHICLLSFNFHNLTKWENKQKLDLHHLMPFDLHVSCILHQLQWHLQVCEPYRNSYISA